MFAILPIGDIQKRRTAPYINLLLIASNVAAFVWFFFLAPPPEKERAVQIGLLVPERWTDHSFASLFTSMFLHADLLHLFGNMLFLWVVGNSVEDRLGHVPYLVFYLLCGLAGAAVHIAMALGPLPSMADKPTLGASAAVSGVIGAYFVFFPKGKIKFILWLIIFVRVFTLPSWGAIGFWIAGQLAMARQQLRGLQKGEQMQVAVFAHLGGLAFGLLWAILVRMFGKRRPNPSGD